MQAPDGDVMWRPHFAYWPVRIGGKRVWFEPVMWRRLPDGNYEYRWMTDAELEDYEGDVGTRSW